MVHGCYQSPATMVAILCTIPPVPERWSPALLPQLSPLSYITELELDLLFSYPDLLLCQAAHMKDVRKTKLHKLMETVIKKKFIFQEFLNQTYLDMAGSISCILAKHIQFQGFS